MLLGSHWAGKGFHHQILSHFQVLQPMELAPTVRIHGASLDSLVLKGPEFPAEQLTKIPF